MTRPILVFGAGGRVGSALLPLSDRLVGVGRACDIADVLHLMYIGGMAGDIAAIINLAARGLPLAEQDKNESKRVNTSGAYSMALLSQIASAPVVHISTDCVFSGAKAEPYTETDDTTPANWYGQTKLDGEAAVRERAPAHIILRTTGVYLSGRPNFLETVLTKARAGDPLEVVTDTLFTPTDARELAKAILMATERLIEDPSVSGTYHFAGPDVMSYMDFAELVLDEAGLSHPLKSVTQADREKIEGFKRPKNAALNSDKFAAVFSYRHRPTRECVKEVVSAALA